LLRTTARIATAPLASLSERIAPIEASLSERSTPKAATLVTVTGQQRQLRGRQAEAERNDRLVLAAARAVVARYGASAPVSAIAEQAGVGMGSLYRRYGSKDDLLRHLCMLAMQDTIAAAERALAGPDAWAGLAGYVQACVAQRTGTLGALAGSIETTEDMWAASRRGRDLLDQLVARARRDGALRDDATALDVAWLIEALGRFGPADPAEEDVVIRTRLTAIALDGLRARPAGERPGLPGAPPTARHFERRWQGPKGRAPWFS
jgi:AcrR family transcriptional regulator